MLCPRYRLVVSPQTCERCQAFPEFRQALFSDYIHHRALRDARCVHAAAPSAAVKRPCCGGTRTAEIERFHCARRAADVATPDCWTCPHYDGGETT